MKNTIYAKLPQPVKDADREEYPYLQVSIDHTKAGYSYYSGQSHKAGHTISFKPCTVQDDRNGGITLLGCVLMSGNRQLDGYSAILDDAARKNPHAIKRAYAAADLIKDRIAAAYATNDKDGMAICITNIIRAINNH